MYWNIPAVGVNLFKCRKKQSKKIVFVRIVETTIEIPILIYKESVDSRFMGYRLVKVVCF